VDIGDRVHQGETLAVLEVPELQAQLEGTVAQVSRSKDEIVRAQHEVDAAEARYSSVHADDSRLQQAAKAQPGLIAQQELDDAQSRDLSAAAQVDAAKAALSAARGGADVARAEVRIGTKDYNIYANSQRKFFAAGDGDCTSQFRIADDAHPDAGGTSGAQE
jgi:multidrug resistance efflux pump